MTSIGIRELHDNLSRYLREVESSGKPVTVTDHGRPIAEIVPIVGKPRSHREDLIARGLLIPAKKPGPLKFHWPNIRLPPGTAKQLIDEDRGER